MNIIRYILLASVLILGMVSCDDDSYSLDKFWMDIATVNDSSDSYDFTLDNGSQLSVAATSTSYKPKYKRVIINYTILGDVEGTGEGTTNHYVKLNRIYDVLTKEPIYIAPDDQNKQDSIGNDPVKIYSIWEGGDYLNIYYGVNVGGGATHYINLVSAEPLNEAVNSDVVKLEFRHNKNDDPEHYGAKNYVSFDLKPFRKDNSGTVNFEISVKEFGSDEAKIYKIEYKYSDEEGASGSSSPDIEEPSDKVSE